MTTTTELATIDPVIIFEDFLYIFFKSEVSILVILMDWNKSYLTSGDGSSKISANITAPSDLYLAEANHALVHGQLHIFGGYADGRKVTSFVQTNQS